MGEVADMMLDGTLCQTCGEFLGNPVGHPRACKSCAVDIPAARPIKPKYPKVVCKVCGKKVKKGQGEKDHMRVVHQK